MFICGKARHRSPTAEQIFSSHNGWETDSAGLGAAAADVSEAGFRQAACAVWMCRTILSFMQDELVAAAARADWAARSSFPIAVKVWHQAACRSKAGPGFARSLRPARFRNRRQPWKHQPVEDGAVGHGFGPDAGLDAEEALALCCQSSLCRVRNHRSLSVPTIQPSLRRVR